MKLEKNEEAVSPVIGVILMVAITVILAAVIAAFVFGMGPPQHAPQASLVVSSATASNRNITIVHNGGDSIDLYHTRAIIDGINASQHNIITTLNATGAGVQFFAAGDNLIIHEAANTTCSSWNDCVSLDYNGNAENLGGPITGNFTLTTGPLTVTFIDTVSNQQIGRVTVTVTS